jgi:hypothetical protein
LESTARRRLSSLPVTSSPAKSPEIQPEPTKEEQLSPGPAESSSGGSSDEESAPAQSRIIRRPPRFQQQQPQQETDPSYQADVDEDDESEPAFQPYTNQAAGSDLASTLKGDNKGAPKRGAKQAAKEATHHSQTSDSSAGSPAFAKGSDKKRDQTAAGALSPRRKAELAARSPQSKGKSVSQDGSDGTPSMGSSFSDLDGKL